MNRKFQAVLCRIFFQPLLAARCGPLADAISHAGDVLVGYCLCILCALFSPLPAFPFFAVALACALITRWAQRQTAEEQKQELKGLVEQILE